MVTFCSRPFFFFVFLSKAYGGEDMEESDEELELEATRVTPGPPKPATAAAAPSTSDTAAAGSADDAAVLSEGARKAAQIAARLASLGKPKKGDEDSEDEKPRLYAEEIIINDFPQKARWKVTNKVRARGAIILTFDSFSLFVFLGANFVDQRDLRGGDHDAWYVLWARCDAWAHRTQIVPVH